MTQTDWQAEQRVLIHWLQQSPTLLEEVTDLEAGGLSKEEAAWMQAIEGQEIDTLNQVLEELREPLREGDIYRAARVALFCGSFVERGADPDILADVMVEMLERSLVHALQLVVEAEDGWDLDSPEDLPEERLQQFWDEHPDWVKGWRSLGFVILPTMTMLARSLEARQYARQNEALMELVDAMEEVHDVVYYISQLLFMTDDEEMVVLHRGEQKGFRIRVEAVRNNFHLFTLLQDALLHHANGPLLLADPPDPTIGSVARGETNFEDETSVDALWGYFHWTLRASQTDNDAPDSNSIMNHLIWGEMLPDSIRTCRGVPVILLEPVPFARSWSANFFAPLHDALRSSVEILEVLNPAAVSEWFDVIASQSYEPTEEPEEMYQ